MHYRPLGKTGLNLSLISYGAASLGNEYGNMTDEARGIRSLHVALDGGVNFIDSSPYYGRTLSEKILGRAFKEIRRDRFILGTKCGRYDVAGFDFSHDRILRSVDESLARLGVDHIDIMQVHDIEFGDMQQVVDEALPALRKAREQGKVRFIGVTGFPLKIFRYILDRTELDCMLSYCHYALNNTSLLGLIPYLQAKGVGIMNASPFSERLLTRQPLPEWHHAPQSLKDQCRRAVEFCDSRGVDIARLALQFCVANTDIATTVPGTANPDNMEKQLRWIEEPVDWDLIHDVRRILDPTHNVLWPVGRPENSDDLDAGL
ncbi:MAG: aldo/keto reductase [Verrucomicrobia bacterium]|nr:aldo/keto reductase [Verrucomicrobiota bacterium]